MAGRDAQSHSGHVFLYLRDQNPQQILMVWGVGASPYDNLFCLLILLIILITSIMAFMRRFAAAGPYLFANLVPLILIGLLHVFTSINTTGDRLPLPAIMTQSLGYSIALVAFIRYLRTVSAHCRCPTANNIVHLRTALTVFIPSKMPFLIHSAAFYILASHLYDKI